MKRMVKIELILSILGIIGAFSFLTILLYTIKTDTYYPDFFRGGNTGALILGLFTACGLLGMILYPVNLTIGNRKRGIIRGIIIIFYIIIFFYFSGMV